MSNKNPQQTFAKCKIFLEGKHCSYATVAVTLGIFFVV